MKQTRSVAINWEELNNPAFNLAELDEEITGAEVSKVITDLPKENAPGRDDFIGAFYNKCWDVVKGDVIAAVQQLSQLRGSTFKLLNTTNIVLLPKKEQAHRIGDYRPISLVHSVAKIFLKILANRLAPRLPEMVSSSQSAFVKKRCIHDNFVLVQSLVKEFHRKKTRALFVKLDIFKAFDSVSWAYLLEILEHLGFGTRWREWISLALSTASSRILLNGIPGNPIKHERGLGKVTPSHPCYSSLPWTPLQRILHIATEKGVFHPISAQAKGIKASLYADDVAIFISLSKTDIAALKRILEFFWASVRIAHQFVEIRGIPNQMRRCSP
jgi:hypothetical protein